MTRWLKKRNCKKVTGRLRRCSRNSGRKELLKSNKMRRWLGWKDVMTRSLFTSLFKRIISWLTQQNPMMTGFSCFLSHNTLLVIQTSLQLLYNLTPVGEEDSSLESSLSWETDKRVMMIESSMTCHPDLTWEGKKWLQTNCYKLLDNRTCLPRDVRCTPRLSYVVWGSDWDERLDTIKVWIFFKSFLRTVLGKKTSCPMIACLTAFLRSLPFSSSVFFGVIQTSTQLRHRQKEKLLM